MTEHGLSDLVVVYRAKGLVDGEIIRGFLEAQGIPASVSQEAAGKIYGLTIGDLGIAEVLVRADDEQKALELLQEMESGGFENEILVSEDANQKALGPQSLPEEDELQQRKKVLILCTGNSARSQIAEAVVNNDCWDKWVAYSAGTNPAAVINPYAVKVLEEAGLFHQGEPKSVEVFRDKDFDLIITVCDNARETCPLWIGTGNRLHIGFEDPAAVEGSDAEKLAAFRKTLKLIRAAIPPVLKEYA